jgi:hypothetical protein
MIRNKNLFLITIFLIFNVFAPTLLASNTQAAASAASAVAAPAAAHAASTLASLDSNLGHFAGAMKNAAVIIGVPAGLYYGYQWWNKTGAIKKDTEAIRRTQKKQGAQLNNIQAVQGEHGKKLDEMRGVQDLHTVALSQIGSDAKEANEGVQEMRTGRAAWIIKLQTDTKAAKDAVEAAKKAVLDRMGLVEKSVTTLHADVTQLRADVKAGNETTQKQVAKLGDENALEHARTREELAALKKLVVKHGVPTFTRRMGIVGSSAIAYMDSFALQLAQQSDASSCAASAGTGSPKLLPTPAAVVSQRPSPNSALTPQDN